MGSTWKITIGTNDLATYSDIVEWDDMGGGPVIQTEPVPGGDTPFRAALANYTCRRTATVTIEHDTNTLSAAFFLTGPETYAGIYDVKISHMDYAGDEAVWLIAGAEVQISTKQPIGPTTISRLTIIGGRAVLQP